MLWVRNPAAATTGAHQKLYRVQNVAFTPLQKCFYVTSPSPWEYSEEDVDGRAMLLVLLVLEVLVLELLVLLLVQEVGRWLWCWWVVPGTTRHAWTLLGK
jgi:hypothetical protein